MKGFPPFAPVLAPWYDGRVVYNSNLTSCDVSVSVEGLVVVVLYVIPSRFPVQTEKHRVSPTRTDQLLPALASQASVCQIPWTRATLGKARSWQGTHDRVECSRINGNVEVILYAS